MESPRRQAARRALERYPELLARIDAKVAEIRRRHEKRFACRRGCHECCQPGLTVGPLEAAAIRAYLDAKTVTTPPRPFGATRCGFLDESGACTIYEARPVVCRSHGAPLALPVSDTGDGGRDVCPLNFTDGSLETLPPADVLNVETVNVILATLTREYAGEGALERTPLDPSALRSH